MNATKERRTFEDRLLVMLRETVEESASLPTASRPTSVRRSTRTRIKVLALVALLSMATVAALIAGGGGVAIGERPIFRVDGLRALREPAIVERELREAGIDAQIVDVPLTPGGEWTGLWWYVTVDGPTDLTQAEFDHLRVQIGMKQGDEGGPTQVLQLPKVSGHVTLFVGRDAKPGEFRVDSYGRINELSPVGALYCLGVDPNDPSGLATELDALGYRVIWQLEANNQGTVVASPPPNTVATWAWLRDARLIDVRLAPEGRAAERYQRDEGTFPAGEQPPWARPCV